MPRIELKPFWQTSDNETAKLYHGDVISVLKRMPAKSVQCVVTSPPYWGLRDYGTGKWIGGNFNCNHLARASGGNQSQGKNKGNNGEFGSPFRHVCGNCGATKVEDHQLGLEKTPQEFVQKMVDVFTEVYRVLKDDGTLWLNLGDTYQNDGNLTGIPWMVAFALRDAGWILRQDIIWSKPAPMPESIKNRCTKAHEYIFLMTKNRQYYCDMELIKTKADPDRAGLVEKTFSTSDTSSTRRNDVGRTAVRPEFSNKRSVWQVESDDILFFLQENHPEILKEYCVKEKLDVWSVTPSGYSGAHFATFPPKLITPCVLAGCPEGGIVLDPFVGSGTTICVALQHGRKSWGIDLSEKYLKECAIPRIEGMIYQYPELHYLAGRERKAVTGLGVSLLNKKK